MLITPVDPSTFPSLPLIRQSADPTRDVETGTKLVTNVDVAAPGKGSAGPQREPAGPAEGGQCRCRSRRATSWRYGGEGLQGRCAETCELIRQSGRRRADRQAAQGDRQPVPGLRRAFEYPGPTPAGRCPSSRPEHRPGPQHAGRDPCGSAAATRSQRQALPHDHRRHPGRHWCSGSWRPSRPRSSTRACGARSSCAGATASRSSRGSQRRSARRDKPIGPRHLSPAAAEAYRTLRATIAPPTAVRTRRAR